MSASNNTSVFSGIPEAPPDPILGLTLAFSADPSPDKINLGVGAYRTEEGKPLILNSVKKAEETIFKGGKFNKEYIPIDGYAEFYQLAAKFLFGDKIMQSHGKNIVTVQSLSGTGAVRVGVEFIHKFMPNATVYISEPTWPNHKNICNSSYVPFKTYRYYSRETNALDFDGMIEDLKSAPKGSVILLHACAHNPTGMDPTPEQWTTIADLMQSRGLFPFFDCAYQGFASGDPEKDVEAVRTFVLRCFEMMVSQSFAKNFGLYGERVGTLNIVCSDANVTKAVRSQLKGIIRPNYSSPPSHGAYIVSTVLSTPELLEEWKTELKDMAGRIHTMRKLLYETLKEKNIHWPHMMQQIGMFSYTGLTAKQVDVLINKHHIYLTADGRISLPGLSTKTVPIVASAIVDAINTEPSSKL